MNNIWLCLMLIAFCTLSLAQAPDTLWTRRYGDDSVNFATSICEASNGGYVAAGYTRSMGNGDIWFIRLNTLGDTLWTKKIGGSSGDIAASICPTSDGKYIIGGTTSSFGAGGSDVWLLKVDTLGDTIWTKTFGGAALDGGASAQQTVDGGYIIVGRTFSFGNEYSDIYLIETDSVGNEIWEQNYGGIGIDEGQSVEHCSDGGYIVVGVTTSFGAGNADVYIIKADSMGDTIWTRTYGGSDYDNAYSIVRASDSGYIVAGHTESFGLGCDVYCLKINESGDTIWTRTYPGAGGGAEAYSVRQTFDEGYIIAGYTTTYTNEADAYLIKTDSIGNVVWTSHYGDIYDDWGWSVQQTADSGYIIAGVTFSTSTSHEDAYFIRLEKELVDVYESHQGYMENCRNYSSTILIGPLSLPDGKKFKIYDIMGRVVMPKKMKPGIYFLEVDGNITQKIIKVK